MTRRYVLLTLWMILVLAVLAWTVASYGAQANAQLKNEILIRHGLLMLVFTLPIGWLLAALIGSLAQLAGLEPTGLGDALLISLTCAIAGYLQWFVLLPWLWNKWRAWRAHGAAPSA